MTGLVGGRQPVVSLGSGGCYARCVVGCRGLARGAAEQSWAPLGWLSMVIVRLTKCHACRRGSGKTGCGFSLPHDTVAVAIVVVSSRAGSSLGELVSTESSSWRGVVGKVVGHG
ncbi:hypothetical protein IF1G_03293 [Cordyceps javanica]|uniref:Uncharacterized protein n=1 Tax=Cordyceps javanica TaxID=43265 RepID=A0A545V752_9HYPO|nr:hypothetical protein IF1G_03293 [Cordyceps javanica]TQW09264.1 hypothetical protein IF2G_03695 [Cordyceps javanica]